MPITPITPTGPSAPNTLTPDAAGAVAVPNTLTPDAAGTIAVPNTLTADSAGAVAIPNTLTADAAGTIAAPNTLPADAAGTIAAPATLASVAPAALPRTLTPLLDLNFADGLYSQSGTPKSFANVLTFTRASSATFINRTAKATGGYDYFVDNALSNVLRVEYDYQTGENLGALIEGASTNLMLQSENLSSWLLVNDNSNTVTVTNNYAKAPDTLTTASRINGTLTDLTSSSKVILRQGLTAAAGNATLSIWVKSLAGPTTLKFHRQAVGAGSMAITSEWKKFDYSATASGSPEYTGFEIAGDVAASVNFDILVWGGQYEELGFATSYIKTEGSTVSRSKDDLENQTLSIPTVNESKTIHLELNAVNISNAYPKLFMTSEIYHYGEISNTGFVNYYTCGTGTSGSGGNGNSTISNIKKLDFVTDTIGGTVKSYENSVLKNSVNSSTGAGGLSKLVIGASATNGQHLYGHISRFTTYDKALTAQEIELL